MKISAVVVTYNKKELLQRCLDALLGQTQKLDKIIVVDNGSIDGTDKLCHERYLGNPVIEYIKMQENTGSGGGFYEGIRKAYEQGFDWIWAIDDDSIFRVDALEKIISSEPFKKGSFGVFASMVLDKDGNLPDRTGPSKVFEPFGLKIQASEEDYKKPYFEVQRIGFCAGFFMGREVLKKAGFPLREFFMGGGDTEYAKRLSDASGICLISASKTHHLDNVSIEERSVFGKKVRKTSLKRLWFAYYSTRNSVFLCRKYLNFYSCIRYIFIHVIMGWLFVIIFAEDQKLLRIKLLIKAVYDGVKGNLGKTIDPKKFTEEIIKKCEK
ncbi:MAG: glycosyltransferase [bacterium]